MRVRLRPAYEPGDLAKIYERPHQHSGWFDHKVRVETTIAIAKHFTPVDSIADLSAGDAAIINALDSKNKYIGDYAPGYQYTGPIEATIKQIPKVDMFICSETLEHIDDPDAVLRDIRKKTKLLILTTPDNETSPNNPEHYWGWDTAAVGDMLRGAGFQPQVLNSLNFLTDDYVYNYQMWVAR